MGGKRVSKWAVRFAVVNDGECRRLVRLPEPMTPGRAHRWARREYGDRVALWLHDEAPPDRAESHL